MWPLPVCMAAHFLYTCPAAHPGPQTIPFMETELCHEGAAVTLGEEHWGPGGGLRNQASFENLGPPS